MKSNFRKQTWEKIAIGVVVVVWLGMIVVLMTLSL
jgi:hypothetical protein